MENTMSTITLSTIAQVLQASGVTANDILSEAGLTAEDAIAKLAGVLGVQTASARAGVAVEVTPAEVATLREALAIQTRILS
jgi:hypothetical protein